VNVQIILVLKGLVHLVNLSRPVMGFLYLQATVRVPPLVKHMQMVQCLCRYKSKYGGGGGGGARRNIFHISTFKQFLFVIKSAGQCVTASGRRHMNEDENDMGREIFGQPRKICHDSRSSGKIIIKERRKMMKC
jgi:hypothetical protein